MAIKQKLRYLREYSAEGRAPVPRLLHRSGPWQNMALVSELADNGQEVRSEGTGFVQLVVEHVPASEKPAAWRAELSVCVSEAHEIVRQTTVTYGEGQKPSNEATSAAVALAGDLWTIWYLTGESLERCLLLQLLGSEAFDATVAFSHLMIAERFAESIARHALSRLTGDPLASRSGAVERLCEQLVSVLPEVRACLAPNGDIHPTSTENGIPLWDERLASWLDAQKCRALASAQRRDGAKATKQGSPWGIWLPAEDAPALRPLTRVADALWSKRVRPAIERESRSKPLHVRANVSADGETHARFPKITSPISWAFGAPGKEIDMACPVVEDTSLDGATEVDGQRFASVPLVGQKALVSRSWSLLPHDRDKYPHQMCMPLSTECDALPVVVSQNQGVVMSTIAGKLALLILASPDVQSGEMSYATLGELARLVYPAARIQPREVAGTFSAVNELSRLYLYLPDGRKLQIFDTTQTWAPERASPSTVIHYGLTRSFMAVFDEIRSKAFSRPKMRGQEFTGDFLMNLSGMLSLPNNQPALLRYYTRACALWNAACVTGAFDPAKITEATPDEWAMRANTLSHGVVEYLEARAAGNMGAIKPWHKSEASKVRKDVVKDLDNLAERGLVTLVKCKRGAVRILPPANWLEARALGVSNGARLHRLASERVDFDTE